MTWTFLGLSVQASCSTQMLCGNFYRFLYAVIFAECWKNFANCSQALMFFFTFLYWWRFGSVSNVVGRISEVNQRQTQLVLEWMTVCRQVNKNISVCNQPPRSTQPGHPCMGKRNEYKQKLGCKQRHTMRCTGHVFLQCKLVSGWGLRKRRS